MNRLNESMTRLKDIFDASLRSEVEQWNSWPPRLLEAAKYSLFGGGKRIRPLLSMMVSEAFGREWSDVSGWACAVEMIHTYSLIHDDLPSMDNDAIRRGRPTSHIQYGEATAILAGDALLTEAFGIVGRIDADKSIVSELVVLLAQSSGGTGMVGGQVYDIHGDLDSVDKICRMQGLKTGALIRASAEGAAMLLSCSDQEIQRMASFGSTLGALFQITDDILDRTEDREADGHNLFHHLAH